MRTCQPLQIFLENDRKTPLFQQVMTVRQDANSQEKKEKKRYLTTVYNNDLRHINALIYLWTETRWRISPTRLLSVNRIVAFLM